MNDGIKLAALQHLYFRFLFDIGDSGTHNILLRQDHGAIGRLIAGIDLEESRKKVQSQHRLDHLFKKGPSKKQTEIYKPLVNEIQSISHSQLDHGFVDNLIDVGIDVISLKEKMDLWDRLK
jgi:hypothetical protein